MRARTITNLYLVAALTATIAVAQPGNLAPNGQFDDPQGIGGWSVANTSISSLAFEADVDADDCPASGAAFGSSDPSIDGGTAEYRVCVTGLDDATTYRITGRFRFDSDLVVGRANVSVNFYATTNCSASDLGGQFAGYARTDVAGWQRVTSVPSPTPAGTQSAWLRVLLTQTHGAQPEIEVLFDDIRLERAAAIFGDGAEGGGTCRWN
ncbi:MAG: hypothetical protein KDB94_13135 [Acidobacteria bacterium]|nr:hypothetical protein [Acidobacteriota bacterium]